jgi:hypothetical protein
MSSFSDHQRSNVIESGWPTIRTVVRNFPSNICEMDELREDDLQDRTSKMISWKPHDGLSGATGRTGLGLATGRRLHVDMGSSLWLAVVVQAGGGWLAVAGCRAMIGLTCGEGRTKCEVENILGDPCTNDRPNDRDGRTPDGPRRA